LNLKKLTFTGAVEIPVLVVVVIADFHKVLN